MRFEMRLTRDDVMRFARLSHRTGERDASKVVRQAMIRMERDPEE